MTGAAAVVMNDESVGGGGGGEEEWEPIESNPSDTTAGQVQGLLIAEAAALVEERAGVVEGNVQDILAAVDDLLKLEGVAAGESGSEGDVSSTGAVRSTTSQDDGDDNAADDDPSKDEQQQQQKKRKGSRLQLRNRLRKARQRIKNSSVKVTRKLVTGTSNTRVRDYVVLPKVVRVLDKYTFTGGVLGMLVTEFVVLQYPEGFRYYNIVIMLPLFLLRVVLFHRTKQQYFLLDYCYWVNNLGFALALLPLLLPTSIFSVELQEIFWNIFFVSANGPLFFAMIAWNNSLVFHSVDKVTSTYVHLFPPLLSWCERWSSPNSPIYYNSHSEENSSSQWMSWMQQMGYPLLFYATWQTVYLIQTEWWHRPTLDADPDLSTSLRYIANAHKMGINKKTLKLCRSVGLMGPTETFSPPTFKVKTIFVVLQMCMTIGTFLPTGIMYSSIYIHTIILMGILSFSVYNGARYYVQVFSRIYDKRYLDGTLPEEEYVDTGAVMNEHIQQDRAAAAAATDETKKDT